MVGEWKEDLCSCPVSVIAAMKILMNDVPWNHWESLHLVTETMHRVFMSSSGSSPIR